MSGSSGFTIRSLGNTQPSFDTFASQKELASLIAKWPAERLVAIWNSLPGVTPVKKFKNAKIAAGKIWERIQKLGEATIRRRKPRPRMAHVWPRVRPRRRRWPRRRP